MSLVKRYPTAEMFDERFSAMRDWHARVAFARRNDHPLYHVRSFTGTTLDLCTTPQEARGVARRERACEVLELTQSHGQRRIAL